MFNDWWPVTLGFAFAFGWLAVSYVKLAWRYRRLYEAGTLLYTCAHWYPDRRIPAGQGEMMPHVPWQYLSIALGLPPGTATERLGRPRSPRVD